LDLALALGAGYRDHSVMRRRHRHQLGGGIEMAERARDGAAVARLAMPDLQDRLAHQRQTCADHIGEFEIALARHAADADIALLGADEGEVGDAVEIDDMVGQHITHRQHRHQRLPTGQQLGILEVAEECDRFGDGRGIVIRKRRGFHCCEAIAHSPSPSGRGRGPFEGTGG